MEYSQVQQLIQEKRWKELEPLKDQILSGMWCKVVCNVCENTVLHLTQPDLVTWKCVVCAKKGGVKSLQHCNQCGATFNRFKGENCNCLQLHPLSSLKFSVDPVTQKKRDEAAKQPKGDGSGILFKKIREFEKEKYERAKRIDKNLEIIANSLMKEVNKSAL